MKVAVVGATGLVGTVMLKVLEERKFPVTELIPVASEKSVGNKIFFMADFICPNVSDIKAEHPEANQEES